MHLQPPVRSGKESKKAAPPNSEAGFGLAGAAELGVHEGRGAGEGTYEGEEPKLSLGSWLVERAGDGEGLGDMDDAGDILGEGGGMAEGLGEGLTAVQSGGVGLRDTTGLVPGLGLAMKLGLG